MLHLALRGPEGLMPCEGTVLDPCVVTLSAGDLAAVSAPSVVVVLLLVALLVRSLR